LIAINVTRDPWIEKLLKGASLSRQQCEKGLWLNDGFDPNCSQHRQNRIRVALRETEEPEVSSK
jgi:hypothetical protein